MTYILAIESSCDETAAAVVRNGREVLSNIVFSQIQRHQDFGGVVPELASRLHQEQIIPVIDRALKEARLELDDLAAIAVTGGPGLSGSLLVGISAAKSLAFVAKKPLINVHHLAGHIAANYIASPELEPPFLALIVSGGHSHIVLVKDYCEFEVLARTRDDAAGEAFDKIARKIGLGYPGGPAIDKIAQGARTDAFILPSPEFKDSLDFSFSGLKTAAINQYNQYEQRAKLEGKNWFDYCSLADFAASFQAKLVSILIKHLGLAIVASGQKKIVLAGGVAANTELRRQVKELCEKENLQYYLPPLEYCTDQAAMIASQAYFMYKESDFCDYDLNARSVCELR